MGNAAKQCRLGLFQDFDFAGDLIIRLFQQVGCVRNKLQFQTVPQNLRSSLWTLDWDWTGFLLSICAIWLFLFLEMFLVFQIDRGNLRVMITNTTSLTTKSMWWKTLMLSLQMSNQRVKELCFLLYVFEDNEAVIEMTIKGRSFTMRTRLQNPQSCFWLIFQSNQSGFQNPNQTHRHQKPTRRHFNQREFHTWWVESFVVLV